MVKVLDVSAVIATEYEPVGRLRVGRLDTMCSELSPFVGSEFEPLILVPTTMSYDPTSQ
jgi:hypothetical protein